MSNKCDYVPLCLEVSTMHIHEIAGPLRGWSSQARWRDANIIPTKGAQNRNREESLREGVCGVIGIYRIRRKVHISTAERSLKMPQHFHV